MQEWQDISTAPRDGTQIILGKTECDDTGCIGLVSQGHWQEGWPDAPDDMGCDDGFVSCDFDTFRPGRSFGAESYRHSGTQPTHFMTLPSPPAAQDSKEPRNEE